MFRQNNSIGSVSYTESALQKLEMRCLERFYGGYYFKQTHDI